MQCLFLNFICRPLPWHVNYGLEPHVRSGEMLQVFSTAFSRQVPHYRVKVAIIGAIYSHRVVLTLILLLNLFPYLFSEILNSQNRTFLTCI